MHSGTVKERGEKNWLQDSNTSRSGYRQDPIIPAAHQHNPYSKGKEATSRPSHTSRQARPRQTGGQTRPSHTSRQARPRHPYPVGHQLGHQGAWASLKETSCIQGRQPVIQRCKEFTQSDLAITA